MLKTLIPIVIIKKEREAIRAKPILVLKKMVIIKTDSASFFYAVVVASRSLSDFFSYKIVDAVTRERKKKTKLNASNLKRSTVAALVLVYSSITCILEKTNLKITFMICKETAGA